MGAWGFKIEDNDIAQDFILDYKELVEDGKEPQEAIEELFQGERYKEDSHAILMAGKLEYEHYGEIKHVDVVNRALKEELTLVSLNNWKEPEVRREELLKFMKLYKVDIK